MQILLIEDDPNLGEIYQTYLGLNHSVTWLNDPQQALATAVTLRPSLIFLDLMMPHLDGLQVLSLLKANTQTKAIPVIMLTNFSGDEQVKKALELGAVKYVVKTNIVLDSLSDLCEQYGIQQSA